MKTSAKPTDKLNPGLKKGLHLHGYEIIRMLQIDEIAAWYYKLLHKGTGATHTHISRDDQENAFSVYFKTVPKDSTGVAHILEHTVLAGSKNYPIRDPFFSMLKRSLNTFMNAFTASDWTGYPFASTNKRDFYNLLDIYLDSAFFPKIDNLSFMQEGIRFDFDKNDETGIEELVYKGVVYNEMKGAMSSPGQVMGRALMNALYPGATYSNNSGGEPEDIPSLTHKQLKEFYARHYHPSNSSFYTHGNLPLGDHLKIINEKVLKNVKRIDPKTSVPKQKRWTKPKELTYAYALDKSEDPKNKYQGCVAWLTGDITDSYEILLLNVLEEYLIGDNAAPMKKALIESKLGSALSDGSGFDPDNRDGMFTFGLKDIEKSSVKKVKKIIFEVLGNIAKTGTEKKLVDSAIHQIKFHKKEITNHPYRFGIKLSLDMVGNWMHGGDAVESLSVDAGFKRLLKDLSGDPLFLSKKIKKYFLDNPHQVLFTLKPDQELLSNTNSKIRKKLDKIQGKLSEKRINEIKTAAKELEELQKAEEDLSCLPSLPRSEVPPVVASVKPDVNKQNVKIYNQATAGIEYFSAAVGAGHLSERLLPLVPFFCYAYNKIGTTKRNYVDLAQRISRYTGGIGLSSQAHAMYSGRRECVPLIAFSGKSLIQNTKKMYGLIEELMFETDFSNLDQLANLLNIFKSSHEESVLQNGHRLAMSRAYSNFSVMDAMNENWSGLHQVMFLKNLARNLDNTALDTLANDLAAIKKAIFVPGNIRIAMVGENPDKNLCDFIQNLNGAETNGFISPDIKLKSDELLEGFTTSTAVSFVAKAFPIPKFGHPDVPSLAIISKLMLALYLHRELREKGGAYGGFALLGQENGVFAFASYRDPHIVNTINIFDKAADCILSGKFTEENVTEAVISLCSEIDKPDPPGPASKRAFLRTVLGLTDQARNKNKSVLLATKKEDVLRVAKKYFTKIPVSGTVVISNSEKLKEANKKLKSPLEIHKI